MPQQDLDRILRIAQMWQHGQFGAPAQPTADLDPIGQAIQAVKLAGARISQQDAEYEERLRAAREARGTPEWLARLIPPALLRASESATATLFGAPEYPQELPGGPTPLRTPEAERAADIVGQIAGTLGQFGVAEGVAGAAIRALGRVPSAVRSAEAFPNVLRAAGRGAATGAALTGVQEMTSPETTDLRTLLQNMAFLGGAGAGSTLARQGLAAVRPGLPRLVEAPLSGAAAGVGGTLAGAPFADEDLAEYLRSGAVDIAALALFQTALTAITPQVPTADFRAKVRQALDALRRGQEGARAGSRIRTSSARADYRAAVNEAYSEARRVNPELPERMSPEMRQRMDQAFEQATARPAPKDVTPPRPQQVTAAPGQAPEAPVQPPAQPPAQPAAQAPALPPAQVPPHPQPRAIPQRIYHGTRVGDLQAFLDAEGNLVLRPGENFGGSQLGVSFSPSQDVAREYASRVEGEGPLRSTAQGMVFEIDASALPPERLRWQADDELEVSGAEPVVIPKGRFRVIEDAAARQSLEEWERGRAEEVRHLSDEDLVRRFVSSVASEEVAEQERGAEEPSRVAPGLSSDIVARHGRVPETRFLEQEIQRRIQGADDPAAAVESFRTLARQQGGLPYDPGSLIDQIAPPSPRVPAAPPQRSTDVGEGAAPSVQELQVQEPPTRQAETPEAPAEGDLPIQVSPDDLPFARVVDAYRWNSMNPEQRARQDQQEYVSHIRQVYEELARKATAPEQQEVLRAQIEEYLEGYRNRLLAILAARSRTASSMVTGPSKFPTKRNQQALERERRLIDQFNAWQRKTLRQMRRAIEEAAPPEQVAATKRRNVEVHVRADIETIRRIEQGDPDLRHLDRGAISRSLAIYIRRLADQGDLENARFALRLVQEHQQSLKRPVFTKANRVWQLLEGQTPEQAPAPPEIEPPPRSLEEIKSRVEMATQQGNAALSGAIARQDIPYLLTEVERLRAENPTASTLSDNELQSIRIRTERGNTGEPSRNLWRFQVREDAPRLIAEIERLRSAPAVKAATAAPEPERAPAPPRELTPVATGSTSRAATERGTEVETQWAVVEASDLVTSHDTNLQVNPEFPQELQPRIRERAASQLQISRMAAELRPEFLAESPKASEGAPIVGVDGVVESGNARTIAVKRAYETRPESAQRYRRYLLENAERFGLDAEAIRNAKAPVLVRVRRSDVDRRQFVIEANEAGVAAMSPTEQAMADAQRLTPAMMELFDPGADGEILAAGNREFISAFLQEIIGPAERARYLTSSGQLSQEGVNRIRNAVFARAYGAAEAVGQLAEATDSNVRNITAGMVLAAPRISQVRERIRAGRLHDLDPAEAVAAAVQKLSDLRSEGVAVETYLQQASLFGDDLDPLAKDFLAAFDKYKRSRKQVANVLRAYADVVEAAGDPRQATMFGDVGAPSKADVLQAAINKVEAGYDPTVPQTALFGSGRAEGEAARAAARRMAGREAGPEAAAEAPSRETPAPEVVAPGMTVAENPRRNSIEVRFDSKTPPAVKKILGRSGFAYSRSVQAWVGRATDENRQLTREIANMLEVSRIAEAPHGESGEVLGMPEGGRTATRALEERPRIRIPAKAREATPATRQAIIDAIERLFAVPIREGRMTLGSGYRGQYDIRQRVIRQGRPYNVTDAAHELGHHIERDLGLKPVEYPELEPLGAALYPKASPAKQRQEGFAEFVALYVIDPGEARAQAPGFFETFTATLNVVPDIREALHEIQRLYQRYLSADPVERVKASITNEIAKERPMLVGWERIWTLWAEQSYPVWKAQRLALGEDVKTEWDVDIAKNPFVLLGLSKGNARISTAWLTEGQCAPDGDRVGPSLREILEPVKDDLQDFTFQAYLVASRIVGGLAERDILTGIDPEDAEKVYQALDSPEFRKAADQIYRYRDNLNEWLVWSGLTTRERLSQMKLLDPFHVPFYRFFGDEPAMGQPRTAGRRMVDLPQVIKRMRGSERPILDPVISLMQNTRLYIDVAMKNRAARSLADLADKAEGVGWVIERLPPPFEADPVKLETLRDDLVRAGIPDDILEAADLEQVALIFNPVRFARFKEKRENIATVWRQGKPVFYQLHPELYRALYGIEGPAANWLFRFLSWPTRVMRSGNVLAPVFAMANMARDLQTFLVLNRYSSGLAESVGALVKGLFHALKQDDVYWDWVTSGAAMSTLTQISRDYLEKDLREMLRLRTRREKVWQTIRLPFTALEMIGQAIEETPRVAQHMLARSKGVPRGIAAWAARNVTIDFQRGGTYGREFNQIKAFFNAAVRGNVTLLHNLRTRPDVWLRAILYITLPTLALYLKNRDDPRYQEMPRWKRDLFWVFFIGDFVLTIPRAHELGILFGTIPERIMEWIDTQDPGAFDDLLDSLLTSAMPGDPRPTGAMDWLPTAVQPWIEATVGAGGWSAFYQGPIVPTSEQDLPPEYRYGASTTETAKDIGRVLNVSPRKVEHVVRGYGGTLAMDLLETLDLLTGRGDKNIGEILFGSRFSYRPYESARSLDEFYTELAELEREYRGRREEYRRRGLDPDRFVSPPERLTELRRVQRQLSDWRQDLRVYLENPQHTREQKRTYEDLVNLYMADLARRALGKTPLLSAPHYAPGTETSQRSGPTTIRPTLQLPIGLPAGR